MINKNENTQMIGINTKLSLPAPQINDDELDIIKKYAAGNLDGMGGAALTASDSAATKALMGNYSQRDILQTPGMMSQIGAGKTPLMSQRIMQEAQNALYYKNS